MHMMSILMFCNRNSNSKPNSNLNLVEWSHGHVLVRTTALQLWVIIFTMNSLFLSIHNPIKNLIFEMSVVYFVVSSSHGIVVTLVCFESKSLEFKIYESTIGICQNLKCFDAPATV